MNKLLKIFLTGLVSVYLAGCNDIKGTESSNQDKEQVTEEDRQNAKKAIVKITAKNEHTGKISTGTGFIVAQDDNKYIYIITQYHVIEGDSHPEILFFGDINAEVEKVWNGSDYELKKGNAAGDALAMLKVTTVSGSGTVSKLYLSEKPCQDALSNVFTYGFPEGGNGWDPGQTDSPSPRGNGLVCQFAASSKIKQGNSGGPLIDSQNKQKQGLIVWGVIADTNGNAVSSTAVREFIQTQTEVAKTVIQAMEKPDETVSLHYNGNSPSTKLPENPPPPKPEQPLPNNNKDNENSNSQQQITEKKDSLPPPPSPPLTCQCGIISSKISMHYPLSDEEKYCISSKICPNH